MYVDTCSYTHMRNYANKRRFMHMWKNSHIFSQTCTPAQEELLTLITDTLMQRHPHTHTQMHLQVKRGVYIYSLILFYNIHSKTNNGKHKYTYTNN